MRFLSIVYAAALGAATIQPAAAQSSNDTPITFDLLQQARAADSLRSVVAKQRGDIARLNKTVAALSDSVRTAHKAAEKAKVAEEIKAIEAVHPVVPPTQAWTLASVQPVDSAPKDSAPKPEVKKPAPAAITFAPPQFTGLLQIWAVGGDANFRSTVRIRRAEVKMVSDLGRRARATVVFDFGKSLALSTGGTTVSVTQSSRALQDGFISLPVRRVQLEAGQIKVPLGYEGTLSSSSLESAERPLMFSDRARGGTFGDIRDVGIVARGSVSFMEYSAGVFNGSGESQNETDRNVGKSAIGRLTFKPSLLRGLQLGASGATSGAATADKPTRDRVGVEILYKTGFLTLQTEAMRGQDGAITRRGGYALAAVSLKSNVRVHVRADGWDPDASGEGSAAAATERDYLAGVTWLPAATRLKLQLVGVHKTFTRNIVPAASQAILNIQASW